MGLSEVISYARLDNALDDLGYKGTIGNRPVYMSLKMFFIERGFLEKRSDDGMLKLRREFTSNKTEISDVIDDGR